MKGTLSSVLYEVCYICTQSRKTAIAARNEKSQRIFSNTISNRCEKKVTIQSRPNQIWLSKPSGQQTSIRAQWRSTMENSLYIHTHTHILSSHLHRMLPSFHLNKPQRVYSVYLTNTRGERLSSYNIDKISLSGSFVSNYRSDSG